MKLNIALDGTDEDTKFENVICSFHSKSITGLDICVRKNLVVTCSKDRTVRVWNYEKKTLEITDTLTDEALSVAFHPSGFHIVVGLPDKILMMNLFSRELKTFKNLPVKGCREIQFSNGGHLFAAVNQNAVQIYNFYTGESPPNF
jgi:WD40 repeat protein